VTAIGELLNVSLREKVEDSAILLSDVKTVGQIISTYEQNAKVCREYPQC